MRLKCFRCQTQLQVVLEDSHQLHTSNKSELVKSSEQLAYLYWNLPIVTLCRGDTHWLRVFSL